MLYAQALQEGDKYEYRPRVTRGLVTLKEQIGHRCAVVDEDGKAFDVDCDDLFATEPPRRPRIDFELLPVMPLSASEIRELTEDMPKEAPHDPQT